MFSEIFQNSLKTPVIKCLFNSCRPEDCSFIKKRFQQSCFPVDFAKFFRTPTLYTIIYVIQNSVLKDLTKFTAKFMWTAASGISENRPCLAGWNFSDVLQNWIKSVFKVLSLSTEIQFSTDLVLMNTQPTY